MTARLSPYPPDQSWRVEVMTGRTVLGDPILERRDPIVAASWFAARQAAMARENVESFELEVNADV